MNEDFSIKNAHCSYCGTRFTEQKLWPRKCFRCYNDSFSNPLPVVVVMQSVHRSLHSTEKGQNEYGIVIQQRGIEPKKGQWALTGGYIDAGETWQEAAVREVHEELGLDIKEFHKLELYDILSSTNRDTMLICCIDKMPYDEKGYDWYSGFDEIIKHKGVVPNNEVQAVDIMWEERELAFPTHTEWANRYLKELNQKKVK